MKTRSQFGAAVALVALGIAAPAQAAAVKHAPTAIRHHGSAAKYELRSLDGPSRQSARWAPVKRYGR